MMRRLEECPFVPLAGTINASGVIKNLNGSSLSASEIFLRETVQNSFDARLKTRLPNGKTDSAQLLFCMRAYHLSPEQYRSLNTMFGNSPFYQKNVRKYISSNSLVIEVSDTNTTGLNGSIEPSAELGTTVQNFTNFVYFTGQAKNKDKLSGGSYGFGKASLFAYSQARTIIVYTRIKTSSNMYGPAYESRFIAVCSDERIHDSNSDRCWWGHKIPYSNPDNGKFAAPILGSDADECAQALGIRPFMGDQTGTKILVLEAGPDQLPKAKYGDRVKTMEEVFTEDMPRYIVHWYWNQIELETIKFSLEYDGEAVEIEDPINVYPYNVLWKAYLNYLQKKFRYANTPTFADVQQSKPQVHLGWVSLEKTPTDICKYEDLFPMFQTSTPVVAFMRGIGHIVYYDKMGDDGVDRDDTCYGCFQSDLRGKSAASEDTYEVEHYFRDIENQTHDRWEHNSSIKKWNYLNTVQKKVSDMVQSLCAPVVIEPEAQDISIVVQRILGEKLMAYRTPTGSPGEGPDKPTKPRDSNPRISGVFATGRNDVTLSGYTKKVDLEYKVKVGNGKIVRIKDVKVGVRTMDAGDGIVYNPDFASFSEIGVWSHGKGSTLNKRTKPQMDFDKSTTFDIFVACRRDCAFDVKVDWEEVNA